MIDSARILQLLESGEGKHCEFKSELVSPSQMAKELSSLANSGGGVLLLGVADNGEVVGLEREQLGRYQSKISNYATHNIKPMLRLDLANVEVDGKWVIAIDVRHTDLAPYAADGKHYYIRQGADVQHAAPELLARLFARSRQIQLDESNTKALVAEQLAFSAFELYIDKVAAPQPLSSDERADKLRLLQNRNLAESEYFNLAGLLLFGNEPQHFYPSLATVECCYFYSDSPSVSGFFDRESVVGRLELLFAGSMTFLRRNLRRRQVGSGFNQVGCLELAEEALIEAVVNALVHRDLSQQASVKIFLFPNRLEIISPGRLPNHLTVAKISAGSAIARNQTLHAVAQRILPYSGLGTGIRRIQVQEPGAKFIDQDELFTVRFPRRD